MKKIYQNNPLVSIISAKENKKLLTLFNIRINDIKRFILAL